MSEWRDKAYAAESVSGNTAKIFYKEKQGFCMSARYVGEDALPYQKIRRERWRM